MPVFYIMDAFSDQLFGGNPAGVVLLGQGTFPTDAVMRQTAAELRYSETAFVRQTGENSFNTRYFTPAGEVELCGHATIGAFCALAEAGMVSRKALCRNQTLAGELEVGVDEELVMMETAAPKALGEIDGEDALRELYGVMGLAPADAGAGGLLPGMVSTGLPDIMLPVADAERLAAIKPDFAALAELSKRYEVVGVHAFTPLEGGTVHCRNFAPLYDIDEEAATGTSNSALTYYLYTKGLITSGARTTFIQGEAMARPSSIVTRLQADEGKVDIRVGGTAVVLARGEIFI